MLEPNGDANDRPHKITYLKNRRCALSSQSPSLPEANSFQANTVSITSDLIEGTCLPFKAELAGEHAPGMALAKMLPVIGAGTYAVHFGGEVTDSGSYTLTIAEGFHSITLVSLHGANAGRTIPSIYQLTGDRLRVCYGLDGTAHLCFDAPTGTRCYLVSCRRTA